MRLLFISGVLMNHVTTAFIHSMSHGSFSRLFLESSHLSLHFTRFGFMFISGLVLVYQYQNSSDFMLTFWYKRDRRVGIPYLFWNLTLMLPTVIYQARSFTWHRYLNHLWPALIHGNKFYMYFLFVIIQFYLLFPFFLKWWHWLDRQGLVLGISFLAQLILLLGIKYLFPGVDRSSWPFFFRSYGMNVFTYQFYFIFGAYTATHYQQLTNLWLKYQRLLWSATDILAIGTFGLFFYNRQILHLSLGRTELIHQPYLLIYGILTVCVTWLLGHHLLAKKSSHLNHLIKLGSRYSFGMYLTQTIPLMGLYGLLSLVSLPSWGILLLLPIGYLFVWGCAWGISALLGHFKITSYVVGLSTLHQQNKARM